MNCFIFGFQLQSVWDEFIVRFIIDVETILTQTISCSQNIQNGLWQNLISCIEIYFAAYLDVFVGSQGASQAPQAT